MVRGPKRHDGTGFGGVCNTFYDGDICIDVPSGGGCHAMTKGQAFQLAHDLLALIKEMEEEDEQS